MISPRTAVAAGSFAAIWAAAACYVHSRALSPAEARARIENPPRIDWAHVADDPSERLVIRWYPLPRFPAGEEGALGERLLEERFNVDIKPIFHDAIGYSRRKPLMFAGGDVPDITWEGDPLDVQRDVFHGCLLPVPREVIKRYAPTYYAIVTHYAPMGWLFSYCNGHNWGVPTVWMGGGLPTPGVWRKDWLDKVGINKPPQTLEEFHEAFRRFTFRDPDGNGKDDTYGLTNTTTGWHQMFSEFFGAYNALPFDWMVRDGEVVWGGITPEAKAALACLAQWYAEGIIDPEFVTDGIGGIRRMKEKLMNGRIGYGYALGQYREFDPTRPDALVNVIRDIAPSAVVIPAALPIGPAGHRGVRNWGTAANIMVFGPGIAKQPQKLIRYLRMLEHQVSRGPETYMLHTYGRRGVHWDYRIPDQGVAGTGPSSGIKRLPPYDDFKAFQKRVLTIWGAANPEYDRLYQPAAERAFNQRHRRLEWCMVDVLGKPGIVRSARKYLGDLRHWQLTVYAEIIRGEKPHSYFGTLREQWLVRGGRVLTAEARELFAEKQRLYARLGILEDGEDGR